MTRRSAKPRIPDTIRRIRKPMPPPGRVEADRRRALRRRDARRQVEEALADRDARGARDEGPPA